MHEARIVALSSVFPGLQEGQPANRSASPAGDPWFDAPSRLPGIKHRYLSDLTRYSMATALDCRRQAPARAPQERRAVVLGSAVADFAVRDGCDRAVLAAGPGALNTVSAPNISANIAAAHVAIACQSRACSTTVTTPFLAGFEALYLALQSLAHGRCDEALAIAAEEALPRECGSEVLPGALALQLEPDVSGQAGARVRALAWGRAGHAASDTAWQRLAERAALHADQENTLAIVCDDSADAASMTERASRFLISAGHADASEVTSLCGPGALEPMLHAVHWMAADRPTLLLAIHQRRYLAFQVTPLSGAKR